MNDKQLFALDRKNWLKNNDLQTLLAALLTVAVTFTIGKSFVNLKAKSIEVPDYQFPTLITLSQWQFSSSKPLNSSVTRYLSGEFVSGKHYLYRQNGKFLEIEIRYVVDTNGDFKSFITNRTGKLTPGLRQDDMGGFYSVYTNENKVNLTACINPNGGSTVTGDRFRRNRMLYDKHLRRIVPWLRGKKELLDKRCLWTHLSINRDLSISLDEHYRILEKAWFDWYEHWKLHYPKV